MKGRSVGTPRLPPWERGRTKPARLRRYLEDDPVGHECSEKRAYSSKEEATAYMLTMDKQDQEGVNAYLCRECEMWHLGHRRVK